MTRNGYDDAPVTTLAAALAARVPRVRFEHDGRVRTLRTCTHCGDPFYAVRRDARQCSARCRVAAHRARVG